MPAFRQQKHAAVVQTSSCNYCLSPYLQHALRMFGANVMRFVFGFCPLTKQKACKLKAFTQRHERIVQVKSEEDGSNQLRNTLLVSEGQLKMAPF